MKLTFWQLTQKELLPVNVRAEIKKITKHLIAEWESVCRDLPFKVKPAIASEAGFTYMGLLYAKAYDIMLITKSQHFPYQRLSHLELVDFSEIKPPYES